MLLGGGRVDKWMRGDELIAPETETEVEGCVDEYGHGVAFA